MSISYWRLKDRYYRLIGVSCEDCKSEFFPPVHVCRRCGSRKLVDRDMPRTGKIVTYTELRETLAGFEDQEPMLLCIVQLENGVKVLGQIVDTTVENLSIGDKVKAVFRKIQEHGSSGQIFYGYKFVKA
ncbi:MAG: Zn-ribbon domain-containing OB-fold protein [Thaumarchaeota archaeon]|nr:Zn-ribbon domain-containing OB-fold protein [Nitrososphaerota archaeon]